MLVAGDVFDAQTIAEKTIRRMFNAMAGYNGPWIMIPGNHDAALTESIWTLAMGLHTLPANLHLALVNQVMTFPESGFAVLCAPLTQRQTHHDLTEWFDDAATPDGLLRIGIAYSSVQCILADEIDSANPIAADRANNAQLDYLALGDWHGCKQINSRTWYSGTPELDRFKSNSPGFALLVEIAAVGAEPAVTQLASASYHWRRRRSSVLRRTASGRCAPSSPATVRSMPKPRRACASSHLVQSRRPRIWLPPSRARGMIFDRSDLRACSTGAFRSTTRNCWPKKSGSSAARY